MRQSTYHAAASASWLAEREVLGSYGVEAMVTDTASHATRLRQRMLLELSKDDIQNKVQLLPRPG